MEECNVMAEGKARSGVAKVKYRDNFVGSNAQQGGFEEQAEQPYPP